MVKRIRECWKKKINGKSRVIKDYVQLAIDTLEIEQNKSREEYKKAFELLFYKFIDIGISKF